MPCYTKKLPQLAAVSKEDLSASRIFLDVVEDEIRHIFERHVRRVDHEVIVLRSSPGLARVELIVLLTALLFLVELLKRRAIVIRLSALCAEVVIRVDKE